MVVVETRPAAPAADTKGFQHLDKTLLQLILYDTLSRTIATSSIVLEKEGTCSPHDTWMRCIGIFQ